MYFSEFSFWAISGRLTLIWPLDCISLFSQASMIEVSNTEILTMISRSIIAVNFPLKTPRIIIQCDWNIALREPDGKIWIICQEVGRNGKHGSITSKITTRGEQLTLNKLEASSGFEILGYHGNWIKVVHRDPNCSYTLVAPHKLFSTLHKHSILSLSVTDGGLGVSACSDNKLRIWDTEGGTLRRELEGHLWDVYCTRFFPSGLVILSAGSDMQLKIWSAENGQCPVTLKGHKAAITDLAIIERGRNVVSVSKDGTASLWDCGQSLNLHVYKPNGDPSHNAFSIQLNCCAVHAVDFNLGEPDLPPSEREVLTEGQMLVTGDECGNVKGFGLRSKKIVFEYKLESAVNCCTFLNKEEIICGTQDGNLFLINLYEDQGSLSCGLGIQWTDSKSAVLSLKKFRGGFFASRADGTCTYYNKESDCHLELTGPDCDPVNCLTNNSHFVFTGCRDSIIRVYKIAEISDVFFT